LLCSVGFAAAPYLPPGGKHAVQSAFLSVTAYRLLLKVGGRVFRLAADLYYNHLIAGVIPA
jgi:hypothetical protein